MQREERLRMESVLYTFAMKFLTQTELNSIEEVFHMTILGQMLEERGVERGLKQGLKQGLELFVRDSLEEGRTEAQILEKLERLFSLDKKEAKTRYDEVVSAPFNSKGK